MSPSRAMRGAALTLAIVILPLAAFAAVSMGLRLDQYGLAPERLWGLVAIVVACAWGLGYWIALARGRRAEWSAKLRRANFHLAIGTCVLALLLALPVFDFGAISARNQLARLQAGEVSPEEFDYAALRWDFGETGKRALARLVGSGNSGIAERARIALAQTERGYRNVETPLRTADDFDLRVQPNEPALRRLVLDHLMAHPWLCEERCVAVELDAAEADLRRVAIVQGSGYQVATLGRGRAGLHPPEVAPAARPIEEHSTVEIRTVPRRYIFVDGKPIGPPLD